MEAETRTKTDQAKKVFDKLLYEQATEKELRKEIQFLKGSGAHFIDKN